MPCKDKIVIGFINSSVAESWAQAQWKGFMECIAAENMHSFNFFGGVLDSPRGFEKYRNSVYSLVSEARIDGLVIWTGGMNWYVDQKTMQEFLGSFAPMPVVCMEAAYEGFPSLVIDDYSGMKQIVDHLITVHHRRKIAFIRGPEKHIGMQLRYKAYGDCLRDHGIGINEELVSIPSTDWDGAAAIEGILRRGADFDALVGANDGLVEGALDHFEKVSSRFPQDISIVGFDDDPKCRVQDLPITTVRPPFRELAHEAVNTIERILGGEKVQDVKRLQPALVIRQSCGCQIAAIERINAIPYRTGILKATKKANCISYLESSLIDAMKIPPRPILKELIDIMFRGGGDAFLPAFNKLITGMKNFDSDYMLLHDVLTQLSSYIRHRFIVRGAYGLIDQGRIALGEAILRSNGLNAFLESDRQAVLRSVSQSIVTNFNLDSMLDNIAREIPRLGINKFYICLYMDKSGKSAKILVAHTKDARAFENKPAFETRLLLPEDELEKNAALNYVVFPLVFEKNKMGYLLFDARTDLSSLYESVATQLSSALQGAFLLNEIEHRDLALSDGVDSFNRTLAGLCKNIECIKREMEGQVNAVEEEVSAIEELVRNIDSISVVSKKSRQFSAQLNAFTAENGAAIHEMIRLILDVTAKSGKIDEFLSLISGIAEQTHILSLNAAIQAANAGAFGRSFAVVAGEIRKLSENISSNIDVIKKQMGQVSSGISELADGTKSIEGGLGQLAVMAKQNEEASSELSISILEQSAGARQIQNSSTELLRIAESVKVSVADQKNATDNIYQSINKLKDGVND